MKDEYKLSEEDLKIIFENIELEFARISLIEELEAVNNYQDRIMEVKNEELKKILQHNMDEEKEHVAMLIEWIRKNDKTQNKMFEKHD